MPTMETGSWKSIHRKLSWKKAQLATQTTLAISSIDFNCMFLFPQFDDAAFVCYRNQATPVTTSML